MAHPAMQPLFRPYPVLGLYYAGLIAGTLDICAAVIFYAYRGVTPVRLLQGIASGLMGRDAFAYGVASAVFGLFLHYLIAFGAAAVFYVASRRIRWLLRHAIAAGLIYGVAVYFFMTYVVIPHSRLTPRPFNLEAALWMVAIHMACVGLPISLAVRRYSGESG